MQSSSCAPTLVCVRGSSNFLTPQAPVCCIFSSSVLEIAPHPRITCSPFSLAQNPVFSFLRRQFCFAPCLERVQCVWPFSPSYSRQRSSFFSSFSSSDLSLERCPRRAVSPADKCCLTVIPASQSGFCSYFCLVLHSPYVTLNYNVEESDP